MRFNVRIMSSPKIISDVIKGFYLSILEDDIFRTLESIESNTPYYTTLVVTKQNQIGIRKPLKKKTLTPFRLKSVLHQNAQTFTILY